MASNSVQLGCAKTSYKYTLSVDWSESEPNIANNTTKITANASLGASNVGFDALYDSYACYLKLYWHDNNNGKDVLFAISTAFTTCGMGYGTRTVSGSITVGHKSDGSLNGYVYVWFEAPTTAGGWSPSSSTCYTDWVACTTIARASAITSVVSPTEYLGDAVTVTIDRKSSDFVHNVQYRFEDSSWIIASTNATTSCTFTPSKDLARYIPKSVTGKLEVSVGTFKGNTQIGDWKYYSITLWAAADCKPYIHSFNIGLDSNGAPSAFNGIYIQGKSKVKASIGDITQSYGSPIKSYRITGPGLDVYERSGISDVLYSFGKLTYTCMVTDYRGRSSYLTNYINVEKYYPPNVSITKVVRCNSDGTTNSQGKYLSVIIDYSCAPINNSNGKSINEIASKSCICNGVSVTSFASGAGFDMAANCDIGKQYTLTASVTDLFGRTSTVTTTVPTAFCILNVNKTKTGLAIGKYSEKDAFEVDMYSEFNDTLVAKKGITQGYGRPESINTFYGDASLRYFLATRNCKTGKPPIDSGVLNLAWDNSNWDMQLAVEKEHLYTRAGSDGAGNWSPWKTYLPVDAMFPVGAIYLTWNDNNPGNFLGGTWVRMAEGRALFGVGVSTDANGFAAKVSEHEQWGYWKHKITVDEMPPHTHDIKIPVTKTWGGNGGAAYQLTTNHDETPSYPYIQNSGGGKDFYTTPPYIGIYVWRRTA